MKKMMKKILPVLLALLLLSIAVSAAGESAVPEALTGIWSGTGMPKNGGSGIGLSLSVNADGTGRYTFIQSGYMESYPFTIENSGNAFSVDIPADNRLGIISCGGTWSLENGILSLDINTGFADGHSYAYTAKCEKTGDIETASAEQEPVDDPDGIVRINGFYTQMKQTMERDKVELRVPEGKCVIAVYESEDSSTPKTSLQREESGLDLSGIPSERLAGSMEEADTLIFIYPGYGVVGAYQYVTKGVPLVTARKTYTYVCLVDVRKNEIGTPVTVAVTDPPQTVTIHYRDPAKLSPIEKHFDGTFEAGKALEWVAAQMAS